MTKISAHERLPISVQILTFNSGRTLARALTSVQACGECIVIDGGSTDDTRKIAEKHGAVILDQRKREEQGTPLTDFAAARNQGLKAISKPWILALDSDEYASKELMEELKNIVEHSPAPAAYYVPRRYVLSDGNIVHHATTYPNERLYFFHRDAVIHWIKPVHERPELKIGTPVKRLKGASLAPLGSLEEYRRRNLRYLAIEVEKSRGKGWGHWFLHRLLWTLRSRLIALMKLLWIWCLPHKGARLPLSHELARFWYGWRLIVATMPSSPTLVP